MIYFPEGFVAGLVYLALALTTGGVVTLLTLLWRDFKARRLW